MKIVVAAPGDRPVVWREGGRRVFAPSLAGFSYYG